MQGYLSEVYRLVVRLVVCTLARTVGVKVVDSFDLFLNLKMFCDLGRSLRDSDIIIVYMYILCMEYVYMPVGSFS